MRGTLNRVLLGLTGIFLLALGLAVLVGGLDLQRRWGFTMPGSRPFDGPKDVLLSAGTRARYRHVIWWWPTAIGGLTALVLLSLWWLLEQLHSHRLRRVHVDSGDGAGAVLRGRALQDIIAAEAEGFDGVARAEVSLTGQPDAPVARLTMALFPHARPNAVVADLDSVVLERARASAGLRKLPAEARLCAVRHRAARVT
jgi:hypothetical protein